jgi:hypothetical protein
VWKRPAERSADTSYYNPNQEAEAGALVFHGSPYPAEGWDQSPVNDPQSLRGRALFDQTVWQVPYPVAEISANNVPDDGDFALGTPENITRWTPWGMYTVRALANGAENQPSGHRLLGNASFFASDPSRGPGSNTAGCYFSTDWTHMVLNQPGSIIIGHQTFSPAPIQPKPSVDFFPSTVYQPSPSFGTVAPKVP